MRLRELDAVFIRLVDARSHRIVSSLAEADGVQFQCPKCAEGKERVTTGGSCSGGAAVRGAHYVICWFRGHVPDDLDPKPGRWTPSGAGLEDLTFVPGEPPLQVSVQLMGGCNWHGYVRGGEATLTT